MVDASRAFDTEAVKRPRSTDDPEPEDIVEAETKNARPDRDEIAKDLVAKMTALDSLWRVNPNIDLTNDAMAL